MKLLICGFMGSGKSFFLKNAKENLHLNIDEAFDFDEELLHISGHESIKIWVETLGWDDFRENEKKLLHKILKKSGNGIYSLGGGTLNEELLSEIEKSKDSYLLWVDTPFEECWQRIKNDQERPLVRKGKDSCFQLFKEREILYSKSKLKLSEITNSQIRDLFK